MFSKLVRFKKHKNAVIALSLVAIVLITGVFAYLTDSDTATNVFTAGDVKIGLDEPNWDPENAENIWAEKVVDKDPIVTNTGDNDAFIYIMVTVPKADGLAIFDEDKGTATVNDYQLFTSMYKDKNGELIAGYNDSNWTLIDYKFDENDTNNYYLFAYNTALAPDGVTEPVFDALQFANVIEGQFDANEKLDVVIDAYAIQSNFGDGNTGKVPAEAWSLYVNQNGWKWPVSPAGNHYSFVNYKRTDSVPYIYEEDTDQVTFIDFITNDFKDGDPAAWWVAENGNIYNVNDTASVKDLFILDPSTKKPINVNPKIYETSKYAAQNPYLDSEQDLAVKLIPYNEDSTAVVERYMGDAKGLRYDTPNHFIESYVPELGHSVKAGLAEYDAEYTKANGDILYDHWFVYGLAENITVQELFSKYVRVQGDGYAEVTPNMGSAAGTGTLIEVFDRNDTDNKDDDIFVESFYVVIRGDINGDAIINEIDTSLCTGESIYVTAFSWHGSEEYRSYKARAADTHRDAQIRATDVALINDHTLAVCVIPQY